MFFPVGFFLLKYIEHNYSSENNGAEKKSNGLAQITATSVVWIQFSQGISDDDNF